MSPTGRPRRRNPGAERSRRDADVRRRPGLEPSLSASRSSSRVDDEPPTSPATTPWSPPSAGTAGALAVAIGALLLIQLRAGLFAQEALVIALGVALGAGAAAVALAWPAGRGVLAGLGLSAAGVAQALVIAPEEASALVVLVLCLWLPATAVTLALADEDQRSRSAPLVGSGAAADRHADRSSARRPDAPPADPEGGAPIRAGFGGVPPLDQVARRRAVRSALVAGAVVAVVAALAAALIRPPGRGDGSGRRGGDWDNVARAGRPATSLGIYQAGDQLDTARRFELSDEVVMRVRADAADFWRGTTYDRWDGRVWTRSEPVPAAEGEVGDVEEETLIQRFTVVAGGSDLLFGAYRPVQHLAAPSRPSVEADGTTVARRPLGPGARYGVVSRRPIVTADLLRRADPLVADLPPALAARYLTLPDVPERVRRLAVDVTAPAFTTFDKVRALEAWLGDNTTYTLDIPPLPEGADAVEQFLFVDRRGYCEQIASSLVVMLRSVGVPARLGVGYAPGERRWGSDEFVVRGRDAHAWVEVWFPSVGWQAFDPTAEVPLSGEDGDSGVARWGRWLVVAVLIAALVALVVLVRRRRRRRSRRWEASVLARLEAAGRRRGRPRHPAETASEYTRALADGVLATPGLHEVASALERATFGPPGAAGDDERGRVEQLVDEAIERAPGPARRRPVSLGRN